MKKLLFLLCTVVMVIFALTGCTDTDILENSDTIVEDETMLLIGSIVIRDNWLYISLVSLDMEYNMPNLTTELGLEPEQFYNWYEIWDNSTQDILRFEITEETVFSFTDSALIIIEDDPVGNISRRADVNLDDFIRYLSESFWTTPIPPVLNPDNINADLATRTNTIPYFVVVKNGRVIRVFEEFSFTQ
ncbi:MAG: hypothetical protein FWG63_09715 [Defluviitaleaceae bacterium]|nr:hypothetical protein [Defluviitaleaceae bacterium]